ncbi:uncharacterized protein LOC143279757 [Babylonia areolata]|uniref:uncharacterized protein LOC143279757 n=1 Tax=Babylonia areolata TaxID=304850 RepID=UPI003FD47617
MPRERQRRSAAIRVFLITGVEQNERNTLAKHIQKLGAVYSKTEHFQSNATHVVCGKLIRSEKFLGALILGRWVVRPEYVTASLQAGRWLEEVDYEWSTLAMEQHDLALAVAAKRNRWRVSNSSEKIFTDWQVAVVLSNTRRQAVYKRLLACGGAKVMDLKLPAAKPNKCSEHLTYLFADEATLPLAQSLQELGVLCLNADFISDFIVMYPQPDPLEYALKADAEDGQAPQTAADDPGGVEPSQQGRPAGSAAPSTATPQESFWGDSRDGDDMLFISQCAPSQISGRPVAATPVAVNHNHRRRRLFEVMTADERDDFEDPKTKRCHSKTSADRSVVCGVEGPWEDSKTDQRHGTNSADSSVIISGVEGPLKDIRTEQSHSTTDTDRSVVISGVEGPLEDIKQEQSHSTTNTDRSVVISGVEGPLEDIKQEQGHSTTNTDRSVIISGVEGPLEDIKQEQSHSTTDTDRSVIISGVEGPLKDIRTEQHHTTSADSSVIICGEQGPSVSGLPAGSSSDSDSSSDVVIISDDSLPEDWPAGSDHQHHRCPSRPTQKVQRKARKSESVKALPKQKASVSKSQKQQAKSSERNSARAKSAQETKSSKLVQKNPHRLIKGENGKCGFTAEEEDKGRSVSGSSTNFCQKPSTSAESDKGEEVLAAACSSVWGDSRQLAASSGLVPGSSQPCPVVITAVMVTSPPSSTLATTVAASQSLSTESTIVTSQLSSLKSTVIVTSQSLPSTSAPVTMSSSQSVSSTSVAVTSSLLSPVSSTTPSKTCGRKRPGGGPMTVTSAQKELKKMKKEVMKGPHKQSLVSTPARKVQSSIQHWFQPAGKENTSTPTKAATDSLTKSEIEKSEHNKVQHMNEKLVGTLQKVATQVIAKSKTAKKLSEKFLVNSPSEVKRRPQVHQTPVSNSVSNNVSEYKAAKLTSPAVPRLSNENTEKLSSSEKTVVVNGDVASASATKDGLDLTRLETSQLASVSDNPSVNVSDSDAMHRSLSEVVSLNSTEEVELPKSKRQENSSCGDDGVHCDSLLSDAVKSRNSESKCRKTVQNTAPHSHEGDSVKTAAAASCHNNAHAGSRLSELVLSARSVNKPRCSKRVKTHTVLMKNYIDRLRRKRKAQEPAAAATQHPSPYKSPRLKQSETPKARRRKTVRGLTGRTEPVSLPSELPQASSAAGKTLHTPPESDSVSASSLLPCQRMLTEESEAENKKEQIPDSAFKTNDHVNSLLPVVRQNSSSRQVDIKSSGACLATEILPASSVPGVSSTRWLLPSARWRLSRAPLPKQFDLTDSRKSSLETLGSKTLVPDSLGLMISSCLDEDYFQSAVAMAHAAANSCPSVELFRQMVVVVKEANSHSLVNEANAIVMSWLDQFPPVTPNLRSIYEEALGLNDWENFRNILQNAVIEAETETKAASSAAEVSCGACMLLRIVMSTLERNFLHFAHSISRQGRYNCLVIRSLWSPSYQVYPNGHTRDLMHFLERAFKQFNSPRACWPELLTLVSLATQCCYLADTGWQWSEDGQVERCSGPMVQELTQALTGGGVDSSGRLQEVLSTLSPPWLLRQVVATLLGDYDDYLVTGSFTSDPITLKTIVTRYFFLLPRLSALEERKTQTPRKKLKGSEKDENEALTSDPKLTAEKINKKNHKGETMLHKAAIKNNISLLKQMLTVPGVDVNSQDYAGWTPLHEACNRGNVECVRALLKFVPSATLDSFFHAGNSGKKLRKVNLNLGNDEGITALHDAVMMNHVSVVKLLLKYGGSSLLQATTAWGYTASDLAKTEEMRQILSSDSRDLSFSQECFSQDADSQEREFVPSSFMYREVLDTGDDSTHHSASLEEVRKFLVLLTLLLRSHLQVLQQQRRLQLQQQLQQQQNGPPLQNQQEALPEMEKCKEDMKLYVQSFERHVRKITTEDVFRQVRVQLCVLESLLTECC